MAGSYNHVVTNKGNLDSNERVVGMLETGGDVFEAVKDMYGMIWWLAKQNVGGLDINGDPVSTEVMAERTKEWVEKAQQNSKQGLTIAKEVNRGA